MPRHLLSIVKELAEGFDCEHHGDPTPEADRPGDCNFCRLVLDAREALTEVRELVAGPEEDTPEEAGGPTEDE